MRPHEGMQPRVYYYAAATNGREVFGENLFRDLNPPNWLSHVQHRTLTNFLVPRRLLRGHEFLWQSYNLRLSHHLSDPLRLALAHVQLRLGVNHKTITDTPVLRLLDHPEDGKLAEPITLNDEYDLGDRLDGFTSDLYGAANRSRWTWLIEKCVPCDCRLAALREGSRDPEYRAAMDAVWHLTGSSASIWAHVCQQPEVHIAQMPTPGPRGFDIDPPFVLWIELVGLGREPVM